MNYNEWVPREVIEAWEFFIYPRLKEDSDSFGGVRDESDIAPDNRHLFRLCKSVAEKSTKALECIPMLFERRDADIERLWNAVNSNDKYSALQFINAVEKAFIGAVLPTGLMTKSEKDKWNEKLCKKSSELLSLLSGTRFNTLLDQRYIDLSEQVLEVLSANDISISPELSGEIRFLFRDVPLLTDLLWDIQNTDENEVLNWVEIKYGRDSQSDIQLNKPNDPDSDRAYFIRFMTNFFGERTGAPHRSLVVILVNCFYGSIDKRKVIELAPWPN